MLLIPCISIIAGVLTFGNGELFDYVYYAMILGAAVLVREDKNIVGALLFLLITHSYSDILFYVISNNIYWKVTVYSISMYALYRFRRDDLTKLIAPVFILLLVGEGYSYSTKGRGVSDAHWYMALTIAWMTLRFCLMVRPTLMRAYINTPSKPTFLDFHLHRIAKLYVLIELITITDYLALSLTSYSSLIIYSAYPYAIQIVATLMLWTALHFSYKARIKTSLFA